MPSCPSEKELLELICRIAKVTCRQLKQGIGDDSAVFRMATGRELLVSCDMLVEEVHFRLDFTTPELLGFKALAVNVSDIAAMGGRPVAYLVSLGLPSGRSNRPFVAGLYRGMEMAAQEYRLALAGGDLSGSHSVVVISITILGEALPGGAALRTGADKGDQIFIAGYLGLSAMGLELLKCGYRLSPSSMRRADVSAARGTPRTRTEWIKRCIISHLAPQPPLNLAMDLAARNVVGAMMDISDGLSLDLQRLCDASGVGAVVLESQLPGCPLAVLEPQLQRACMLHGGEDYALLFSVPKAKMSGLRRVMERHSDVPIARIGEVTTEPGIVLKGASSVAPLPALGYDHFLGKQRIKKGASRA